MNLWNEILQFCKDRLFPIFCLDCGLEGYWWCEKCIRKNVNIGIFCCPVCHVQNANGGPCYKCKAASPLNGVAAFLDYNSESVVAILIKKYKYSFAFDIVSVWEKMVEIYLIDIINKMNIEASTLVVIPVPLHIRRKRERGFNQSEFIAKLIYEKIRSIKHVECDNKNFQRKLYTTQQAKLKRIDRFDNLKEAFVWLGKEAVPKNILLIDDVYTSGATMQECTRVLKKFGAQKVYGFTLARD